MKEYGIDDFKHSSILKIYSIKDNIQTGPVYQRMADVWPPEKKQLLIDSIINEFDIPKIYLHEFNKVAIIKRKKIKYAIIDGRQRLEAIWAFIDGDFPLHKDFVFFMDDSVTAGELTYGEIAKQYPGLKLIFDSYTLPIIKVSTEDIDLIEEMFSRLNEAVPLNAAEKRNAFGGPMASTIRKVASHKFFTYNTSFPKKRYQEREMSCKFLWLTHSGKAFDTKKIYLDTFVKQFKAANWRTQSNQLLRRVEAVLSPMSKVFIKKDPLLRNLSLPIIYYLVFMEAINNKWLDKIDRKKFLKFEDMRLKNRRKAEIDISKADYDLLEFDRLSQQGTNDGSSIMFRMKILSEYLEK